MKQLTWPQAAQLSLLALTCAILTACGGGGGTSEAAADASSESAATLAIKRVSPIQVTAPGTGYFVDSAAGSDTNAGSFEAPWKTLARVSKARLQPGEGIWLRCGSVWRESLALSTGQLVNGSTLSAYGTDCNATNKPRITGADDLSGTWVRNGNIWSRSVPAGLAKIPKVFVNGQALRVAQWPNFGGVGREYKLTDAGAVASTTAIQLSAADRAALAGKDVAGATVQVRSEPWMIEAAVVAGLGVGGLTLQAATSHPVNGGDGFVLQDKAWMLDAPGEFFHDVAAGKLYVVAPDDATQANLNAARVEAMAREVGVVLSGRSGVSVTNVQVDMARTDGVTLNQAPGAMLAGVDASNNVGAGVRVNLPTAPAAPARGATIKGGRFLNNGQAGVDAGNGQNVDISGNTVAGTGMGQAQWANAGIVAGDGATVDGNVIRDSAFRGVLFSGFKGTRVSNNQVSAYCLRLSDCAALYTVNSMNRSDALQSSVIEGNRVQAATFSVEGTVGGQVLAGIYLDDYTRNASVRSNVLQGMPVGIFVHNASANVVDGNRVWLSTDASLVAVMDHTEADLLTGNVFRNNQLVPASSAAGTFPALPQITASQAIRFLHALEGSNALRAGLNAFSGNRIVAFNGEFGGVADVGARAATQRLSAAAWAALNPAEPLPAPAATFAVYKSTLGAELLGGSGFEGGLGDWTSYFSPAATGGNVALVAGWNGCEGNCARITSGMLGDRLSSPLFRMTAGTQYLIAFTASFGGSGEITHPNIARPVTPYESYVDEQGLKTRNSTLSGNAGDVIRYEAFFTSNSSDPARINLRVATPGVPVAFDSVSLRPVVGYTVSNFGNWGAVVAAEPGSALTVGCTELGWAANCTAIDVDGAAVSLPVSVPAGTSRLLLWANSSWRL